MGCSLKTNDMLLTPHSVPLAQTSPPGPDAYVHPPVSAPMWLSSVLNKAGPKLHFRCPCSSPSGPPNIKDAFLPPDSLLVPLQMIKTLVASALSSIRADDILCHLGDCLPWPPDSCPCSSPAPQTVPSSGISSDFLQQKPGQVTHPA